MTFPNRKRHDAHKLPAFDVEINAFEDMQRLSAAVSLVYVFKMYHILMQTSTLPPRSSAVVGRLSKNVRESRSLFGYVAHGAGSGAVVVDHERGCVARHFSAR